MFLTYDKDFDEGSLRQGDILRRSDGIEAILEEVHPHYFQSPDYRFFLVLTQTCDLVRRNGQLGARYITIAAVRPYSLAVKRFIQSIQYNEIERTLGLCEERRKVKLEQFLSRLLNNNESDYFFLKSQQGTPLGEDHCAFLHLSVALKADLHFDTLKEAKVLQLRESFQHKLGYLTGQIYSRVGTKDWVPDEMDEKEFQEELHRRVEGVDSVLWLETPIHRQVLKGLANLPDEEQTLEAAEVLIGDAVKAREQRLSDLLDMLEEEARGIDLDPDDAAKLRRRLTSRGDFRALVK